MVCFAQFAVPFHPQQSDLDALRKAGAEMPIAKEASNNFSSTKLGNGLARNCLQFGYKARFLRFVIGKAIE